MGWSLLRPGRPPGLRVELILDQRLKVGKAFVTGDRHHQYVHIHPDSPDLEGIFERVRVRLFQIYAEQHLTG